MRNWFKRGLEKRDSSYTDALVAAITLGARRQGFGLPDATAALEACVGFVGRAFAGAEVSSASGVGRLLDPPMLSMIGRALIRRGEIVFYIDSSLDWRGPVAVRVL